MTEILFIILAAAFFCLAPAAVLCMCRRVKLLGKTGPVLLLYITGIVAGNTGIAPSALKTVQEVLSSAAVPLAIPLMLFGCRLRRSISRSQLLALITGMAAVTTAVVAGYLLFGRNIPQGAQVGGMLTGVYTGGTINLAALKTMLGVNESTYMLINSYDMAVSFLYLTFLLSVGIRLFRRLLPYAPDGSCAATDVAAAASSTASDGDASPVGSMFTRRGMRSAAQSAALALAVCAVSGGIAAAIPERYGLFMTVFILLLTTLGIGCSFVRKVREMPHSYDMGMYLIYIFCITVASMANLGELSLEGGARLLLYLFFVVFGSLAVQALLARLLHIDADTMVIASVTFINSPPFVPMIAGAMNNRNVIVAGLTIGVVGYAAGNYLGFIMAQLLEKL